MDQDRHILLRLGALEHKVEHIYRHLAGVDGAPPVIPPLPASQGVSPRVAELARAGDVVVIAGKGHEQGQELAGGVKVPFDDVAVAREALQALRVRS